jgi:hypothetical protein
MGLRRFLPDRAGDAPPTGRSTSTGGPRATDVVAEVEAQPQDNAPGAARNASRPPSEVVR